MSTIRYQRRGNKFYVYELTYYWDKEARRGRQTSKYLGCSDSDGGAYSKTGRQTSSKTKQEKAIVDCGDTLAINQIAEDIQLKSLIKDSFGGLVVDSIMNLMCYQITEGATMQNCSDWHDGNIASKIFTNAKTSSQEISRLINLLGKQELQQSFFKNYIAKFFKEKTGLLIDSTSLPSAINANINTFGYSPDGIKENVTALILIEKTTKLPIYFRAIGGDIADTSTLKTTLAEIKHLGLKPESALLDAGFCSKSNLELMCRENLDFITRLPKSHNIFFELVDQIKVKAGTCDLVNYGDRIVFVKSEKLKIYGTEMFAHVILDPSKRARDINIAAKNNPDSVQDKKQQEALNKKFRYSGYFILLSRSEIIKEDVLPNYYTRQDIEQIFGFAKANNNLPPLKVHSETAINGYLMLVFLALIVYISMRSRLKQKITMNQALLRLRGLKAKIYDDAIMIQEHNKKIKDISKLLEIILPTNLRV